MKFLALVTKAGLLLTAFKSLFAYLDPGSGSLIVQLLVAAIVGILATFRLWKSRLFSLFGIQSEPDEEEADEDLD